MEFYVLGTRDGDQGPQEVPRTGSRLPSWEKSLLKHSAVIWFEGERGVKGESPRNFVALGYIYTKHKGMMKRKRGKQPSPIIKTLEEAKTEDYLRSVSSAEGLEGKLFTQRPQRTGPGGVAAVTGTDGRPREGPGGAKGRWKMGPGVQHTPVRVLS